MTIYVLQKKIANSLFMGPFFRHISCEPCNKGLAGGYDRKFNQIVICENYCQVRI